MFSWSFRKKVRLVWWVLITCTLCALPFTIWEFKQQEYSGRYVGWVVAGIFVILTLPISIYQVALHINYFNKPDLQRQVVRIILMVPVYALVSWASLRYVSARRWLAPLCEVYEAVVLYSFHCYLTTYLRYKTGDYPAWCAQLPPQAPLPPLNGKLGQLLGMRTITDGEDFMARMRTGVLAYVFVRPCLALIQVWCMLNHTWREDKFSLHSGWLWCVMINNATQFWALYCLVALYHATHHALEEISPLRKFVTIKMVVFFSFWQGLLLSVLGSLHLIGNREWTTYQYHDLTAGVQSMIVCIECLPAALAFAWAFPPRDYMEPGQAPGSFMANVKSMFDVRDIFTDVAELVDDQVQYAGYMAASSALDVANAAHGIARSPRAAIAKPIRHLASYLPVPVPSSTLPNGHNMETEGRVLTPLLSKYQSPGSDQPRN